MGAISQVQIGTAPCDLKRVEILNRVSFGNVSTSIIIPALNEEKNICHIIPRLQRAGYDNILIVDGHSRDGTVEAARTLGAKVIIQNGQGKGGALREAFEDELLDGDVIAIMDADGSMDPKELPQFTEAIRNGADVVKGSRFLPRGGSEDLTPIRRVGNMILTGVLNFLFLTGYTDLCYGYIAFRREALLKLSKHLVSEKFEIETEICIKSKTLGLDVREVPSIERARHFGSSNLSTFKDGFRILKLLIHEAFRIS
jgi:glycosyltransferase involved in cell wall biosynthesis